MVILPFKTITFKSKLTECEAIQCLKTTLEEKINKGGKTLFRGEIEQRNFYISLRSPNSNFLQMAGKFRPAEGGGSNIIVRMRVHLLEGLACCLMIGISAYELIKELNIHSLSGSSAFWFFILIFFCVFPIALFNWDCNTAKQKLQEIFEAEITI